MLKKKKTISRFNWHIRNVRTIVILKLYSYRVVFGSLYTKKRNGTGGFPFGIFRSVSLAEKQKKKKRSHRTYTS